MVLYKVVKLLIPENCFVIWNSKTIHANTGISNSNSDNLDELPVYITLLPSLSSEENRQKKIEAYLNGDTCSHGQINAL